MSAAMQHRGGAPVGFVSELGVVEAGAVRYLRLWCEGPESQNRVWSDFSRSLGTADSRAALQSFEALCDLCTRHARRPLMRHHVSCECLGADESCFANFIGYASEEEREDALMLAATFVRADMAAVLVGLAQEFGLALKRMSLAARDPEIGHAQSATLH